ncbi:uncharacterized protein B0P05DRAFT_43306 [Gilbertella persicaria]|uniref:uncharacterized protein n=1 Tax=Gilbertella persicaria TaxID=101096 RepID=UPI00221FECB7|nr:uncharacterized protein B0P05DRAFT_43306 [Gilbertella persicaria]KAI8084069.1 hypothetical protein B0P05DRAFT_43306 [Gilbertella persicaria]
MRMNQSIVVAPHNAVFVNGELFCSTPSKFIWLYILIFGSTLYGFNRKDQGTVRQ